MLLDADGYRLAAHVRSSSPGAGAALLVHGFAGSGADWEEVLGAFPDDWTVAALDLPGHGGSDRPVEAASYELNAVADALARASRSLAPAPPVWVGYSFGARILLTLALRHPDRVGGLVLESVHPGIDDSEERAQRRRQDEEDATLLEREGLDTFFHRWHARPVFDARRGKGSAWEREVERKRRTNDARTLALCLRNAGLGVQPATLPLLGRVTVPTLVVAGAQDAPYRALGAFVAAAIPGARTEVVPGVGHAPHLEAPQAFSDLVRSFLPRLARAPRPAARSRGP